MNGEDNNEFIWRKMVFRKSVFYGRLRLFLRFDQIIFKDTDFANELDNIEHYSRYIEDNHSYCEIVHIEIIMIIRKGIF